MLAGLFYSDRYLPQNLNQVISIFSPSLQNALNDKYFSQEDLVKSFLENFFCSQIVEFYLREINKQSDIWSVVIQNNGDFIIDWNDFIVKLIIKALYFIEWKLFITQTNNFSPIDRNKFRNHFQKKNLPFSLCTFLITAKILKMRKNK